MKPIGGLQKVKKVLASGKTKNYYYARRALPEGQGVVRVSLGSNLNEAKKKLNKFRITRFPLDMPKLNKPMVQKAIGRLMVNGKSRAAKKGLEWSISKAELWDLLEHQHWSCALSGIPFSYKKGSWGKGRNPYAVSIDRIDSRKGYTLKNVRLVTVAVNYALSDWGDAIFFEMCERTRMHQEKENKERTPVKNAVNQSVYAKASKTKNDATC
ncbi:MAG: hypothetical protein AAF035_11355 [Pseudomonadota bacterium]